MPPTQKLKKMKNYTNENRQKHIILVNLVLREYQNRIQHVNKSAHAKYELCSCSERRVMTILYPPGPKIMQNMNFVAARGCQGLPGAARNALRGQSSKKDWYLRIQGRMQIFRFFIVFRVFEKGLGNLF